MRFSEITSITGKPGLYKMESQKPSGVIVTSLTEGWTKFISNREHLFSPLENISIYAEDDTIDLLDVMLMAYEKKDTIPPADAKADNETLKAYFEQILPTYDKEKVHLSDIKKFVKWFAILEEKGVFLTELEEKKKEKAEEEKVKTEEPVTEAVVETEEIVKEEAVETEAPKAKTKKTKTK